MVTRVADEQAAEIRQLVEGDTDSAQQLKDLVLGLLDGERCHKAADELVSIAEGGLAEHFGDPLWESLLLLFGDAKVGARVMRAFQAVPDSAIDVWQRACHCAGELLLQSAAPFGEAAAGIIGAGLARGLVIPTEELIRALVADLPVLPHNAWRPRYEPDGYTDTTTVRALCECYERSPDLTIETIKADLQANVAETVEQAAIAISTLLRAVRTRRHASQLGVAILTTIERIGPPAGRRHDVLDTLVTGLADCLEWAPTDVIARIVESVREFEPRFAEAVSRALWESDLKEDTENEWTLAVFACLADDGVDAESRWHLADGFCQLVEKAPRCVLGFWPSAFDTLTTLWAQMEFRASSGVVTPDARTRSAEIQFLSTATTRTKKIAQIAASQSPVAAFEDIENRLASRVGWSQGFGALLEVAVVLSVVERTLTTRIIPLLAKSLGLEVPSELAYGAIAGCAELAERRPGLFPPDLLSLLCDRVRSEDDLERHHLASVFRHASVSNLQTAESAAAGFEAHVREWCSRPNPPFRYVQHTLRALRQLADDHKSLRPPFVELLRECAKMSVDDLEDVLHELSFVAIRYGAENEYLETWVEVSRQRTFLAGVSGVWPHIDDSFALVHQFAPAAVRKHAAALADLSRERQKVSELRAIAGLQLTFGEYGHAAEVLESLAAAFVAEDPYAFSEALAHQAQGYAAVIRYELARAEEDQDKAIRLLDECYGHLRREQDARDDLRRRRAGLVGMELEEQTALLETDYFSDADWLRRWRDFRDAWSGILLDRDAKPADVEWLRKRLKDDVEFGPDGLDQDCFRLVDELLSTARLGATWEAAVLSGSAEADSKRQATIAAAARAVRLASKLSESRMPALFGARIQGLNTVAQAVSLVSGAEPLLHAIARLPLPVPRGSLPVVKGWTEGDMPSRQTSRFRLRPRSLKTQPWLAHVAVMIDGSRATSTILVRAAVTYEVRLEFHLSDQFQGSLLRVVVSSTLPRELYRFDIPEVTVHGKGERIARETVVSFERAQSGGSAPHQLKLLASATSADGTTRNVDLFGDVDLQFRVLGGVEPDDVGECAEYVRPTRLRLTARRRSRNYDVEIGSHVASLGAVALSRFVRLLRGTYLDRDGWIPAMEMFPDDDHDKVAVDQAVNRIKEPLRKVTGLDADALLTRDGRGKVRIAVDPASISWDEGLADVSSADLRSSILALAAARDQWLRHQSADRA